MDVTRRGAVLALLVLAAGCHQGGKRDLMERELRHQEDRIYQLQDYIERYQDMLDSCRRENEALKKELALGRPEMPERPPRPDRPRPVPDPRLPEEPPLWVPDVDPGVPTDPDAVPSPPPEDMRPGPVPDLGLPDDAQARVHSLGLNKLLTGGMDADGEPGHEGVMVVIEPRDEQGEVVPASGEVSLMVVDPASSTRIARWDYTYEEAAKLWRRSLLGHGLHFELPWPNEPPPPGELRLHARLVTADGRKLLAEHDFHVDPQPTALPGSHARRSKSPDGFVARKENEKPPSWQLRQEPLTPAKREQPVLISPEGRQPVSVMRKKTPAEPAQEAQSPPSESEAGAGQPPKERGATRPTWAPYR